MLSHPSCPLLAHIYGEVAFAYSQPHTNNSLIDIRVNLQYIFPVFFEHNSHSISCSFMLGNSTVNHHIISNVLCTFQVSFCLCNNCYTYRLFFKDFSTIPFLMQINLKHSMWPNSIYLNSRMLVFFISRSYSIIFIQWNYLLKLTSGFCSIW